MRNDNNTSLINKIRDFFSNKDNSSLSDTEASKINETLDKRNTTIIISVIALALVLFMSYQALMKKKSHHASSIDTEELGEVIDSEFSAKDASSAEHLNATSINEIKGTLSELTDSLDRLNRKYEKETSKNNELGSQLGKLKKKYSNLNKQLEVAKQMTNESAKPDSDEKHLNSSSEIHRHDFSSPQTNRDYKGNNDGQFMAQNNPKTDYIKDTTIAVDPKPLSAAPQNLGDSSNNQSNLTTGIDTFVLDHEERTPYKRTYKNYVPSGSFVTAVITGGAEVNAGVDGESSTATILMRTLNDGILPNGKTSHLKDCSITGSGVGDISSQRGHIRTDRLSCIKPNGDVMDIPVEASVFSFGKMGVRGEVIMRNGKILRSLGISSLFDGIGKGFGNDSTTTSNSPLGSTSTVTSMGKNILGSSMQNMGQKLSDYYAKLVRKYHPDIDVHSGSVVNVVFLKGFPLDGGAEQNKYSQSLNEKREDEKTGDTANIVDAVSKSAKNSINANKLKGLL